MIKPKKIQETSITQNETYIATCLAEKLRKKMEGISNDGVEIDESIPIIYTEKKAGVLPSTNIRTDRFEVAREAMEKINRAEAERYAKVMEKKKEMDGVKTALETKPSDGGSLS